MSRPRFRLASSQVQGIAYAYRPVPVSAPRCSIAGAYPPRTVTDESLHKGAQPRSLTAIKGALTPIYVLKLSSEPSITKVPCTQGRSCTSAYLFPGTPTSFLTYRQPTRAASVTPFISERPGGWICTTSRIDRVSTGFPAARLILWLSLLAAERSQGEAAQAEQRDGAARIG